MHYLLIMKILQALWRQKFFNLIKQSGMLPYRCKLPFYFCFFYRILQFALRCLYLPSHIITPSLTNRTWIQIHPLPRAVRRLSLCGTWQTFVTTSCCKCRAWRAPWEVQSTSCGTNAVKTQRRERVTVPRQRPCWQDRPLWIHRLMKRPSFLENCTFRTLDHDN